MTSAGWVVERLPWLPRDLHADAISCNDGL